MLGLDLATIVFQAINFVVLAYVLNRVVFKSVLKRAEERLREKEQLLSELAEEKKLASAVRTELEQRLVHLDEEAAERFERLREEARSEREAIVKEATAEAERLLVQAEMDARRIKQTAVRESSQQLLSTVVKVSGILIGRAAPPQMHDTLVTQLVERIREMGRSDMQRVEAFRRSLTAREPVAHVTSARELTVEQQGQLARMLTALADRHVSIDLHHDPSLVAGLRLRLGDVVIDDSIAGQLEDLGGSALTSAVEQSARD